MLVWPQCHQLSKYLPSVKIKWPQLGTGASLLVSSFPRRKLVCKNYTILGQVEEGTDRFLMPRIGFTLL